MTKGAETEELLAQLQAGVETLTTGEDWQRMLSLANQMHHYSFGNLLLIASQRPGATTVAGYRRWQSLGRQVRRGEKSIRILAPVVVRKHDDATGEDVRALVAFRGVGVFDVSQTEGEPLPEPIRPVLLDGEAPTGAWDRLAAFVAARGFSVERGDCGGANGTTDHGARTVRVRADVSDAQAFKTLAHEAAHVLLHGSDAVRAFACRGRLEVEAESTAYVVAGSLGLPTDGYSFPYVAGWSDGDIKAIQATGQAVLKTAEAILAAVVPVGELVAA